jgi:hypothetical protein
MVDLTGQVAELHRLTRTDPDPRVPTDRDRRHPAGQVTATLLGGKAIEEGSTEGSTRVPAACLIGATAGKWLGRGAQLRACLRVGRASLKRPDQASRNSMWWRRREPLTATVLARWSKRIPSIGSLPMTPSER